MKGIVNTDICVDQGLRNYTGLLGLSVVMLATPIVAQTTCEIWYLFSRNTNNKYSPTCICPGACRLIVASGYCCETSIPRKNGGPQAACFNGEPVGPGKCDHNSPVDINTFRNYIIGTSGDPCSTSQGEVCWNS
jgi:hypothetical protein